jgi:putative addiction module component (TIGR02574 family)
MNEANIPGYTDPVATIDKLREEALRLPASDRAKLAAELLESLDDEDREQLDAEAIEKAWAEEIQRRTALVRSGKAELLSEEEAFAIIDGE